MGKKSKAVRIDIEAFNTLSTNRGMTYEKLEELTGLSASFHGIENKRRGFLIELNLHLARLAILLQLDTSQDVNSDGKRVGEIKFFARGVGM